MLLRHILDRPNPALLFLVLGSLLLLLPALPTSAGPPTSGRYQARTGAVRACGGTGFSCSLSTLGGWIEVESSERPAEPGTFTVWVTDSELYLLGLGGGSQPFPA
ncbi:MAG TPA: hypothetical protein VKU40_19685, partial [Thermoanaerobaculia bacterium]|nr:hypothetical protein [Thermoanaerobaculia bacterium]